MARGYLTWFTLCVAVLGSQTAFCAESEKGAPAAGASEYRIGWIGALTGPVAKYGASQAADLAVDDINSSGGIHGRRVRLIKEDAQCKPATALSAFRKLVDVDKVKFILGGHCSPESVTIAPLVDRANVLTLASISSSIKFTGLGRHALRLTPVSAIVGELTAAHTYAAGHRRAGVIQEETDYVVPAAERFKAMFEARGGAVTDVLSFSTGESDFRSFGVKLRAAKIDTLYLGVQSVDSAALVIQQLRSAGLNVAVYGNEVLGSVGKNKTQEEARMYSGITFAEPDFNPSEPTTAHFISRFKERYHMDSLPMGIWTAEAYDSVQLLVKAIVECGEDIDQVRNCLVHTKNYPGVSGAVTITENGDGLRSYVMKEITPSGETIKLQ